jgi:hypothetical protein
MVSGSNSNVYRIKSVASNEYLFAANFFLDTDVTKSRRRVLASIGPSIQQDYFENRGREKFVKEKK